MSRLFIAAWPPEKIFPVLRGLRRDDAPGLRWTTPEQWHVTLRYLGEVDEDLARAGFGRIDARRAEAEMGPSVQRLDRGLVIVPVGGLDDLAASVHEATSTIGDPPHVDGFRGHLTLARQRRGDTTSADGRPVAACFVVDEIALVRSELHPDGARYTTVATLELSA